MLMVVSIGLLSLILIVTISYLVYDEPLPKQENERVDLIEVLHADTSCTSFWRVELLEMKANHEYDYKNDPIFIECYEALQQKKEDILE